MNFKPLGRTGVQVSALCFGTMSFGGDADEAEAGRMYRACRDQGVNFFDCANVYSRGRAEEILGGLFAGHRDEVVITSKCAMSTGNDVNARGGSRRYLTRSVEQSLRRLDTDRLDVLFMHRWDPLTPLEETLRALEDLVRDGKVLYLGASNYAGWQIAKGLGISDRRGWSRFEVLQPMYNLVKRQAEVEILPLAAAEEIGVITYGPVGGGLLSGKYGSSERPASGRLIDNSEYHLRYGDDWVFGVAEAFTRFAAEQGVHPVSLAVAWVAAHPAVTCPIIGARDLEQLQPSLRALTIPMTASLRDEISALSPAPAPATDRSEERSG